jgi:isopentenyldiphosphate isomerase
MPGKTKNLFGESAVSALPHEEIFDVVDAEARVVGSAPRSKCHGDPSLIHRAAHVVVIHPAGDKILLQKRSASKDVQPGKWDSAVGGHLARGETFFAAARREMTEELGIPASSVIHPLFDMRIRNSIESENVMVFYIFHSGPFNVDKDEIDEVRFWTVKELRQKISGPAQDFTPNLKEELGLLLDGRMPEPPV